MRLRLAVVVSHPIQHFAPWHREISRQKEIDLRVFFCCDWGLSEYVDPNFEVAVKWDIPLLEGYDYEILPITKRPKDLSFWEVDNPAVQPSLDSFDPDVVQVFGYAHRTNWRAAAWARRRGKPLMLYSDSYYLSSTSWWRRFAKRPLVQHFYNKVDGAFFVGDNNLAYHLDYGLSPDRLFRGALPIDRERLLTQMPDRETSRTETRTRLGIPADAFVVLYCGKYIPRKRPLDLVAASAEAAKDGVPVWSILVGEGSERGAIEEFCQQERVSNSVLTGFINQSAIPDYFAAADVLAVTSSRDPHPLVISEASAFGLPVVVSDQVGSIGANDTARPGVNALVYRCGDRKGLRRAIETMYKDSELYRRMAEASRRISETQDAPVVARALAQATNELHRLGPRTAVRAKGHPG